MIFLLMLLLCDAVFFLLQTCLCLQLQGCAVVDDVRIFFSNLFSCLFSVNVTHVHNKLGKKQKYRKTKKKRI